MTFIPKILTNKTVLTGIPASFSAFSIFKPATRIAGVMGKVPATVVPSKKLVGGGSMKLNGGFTPSLAVSSAGNKSVLASPFYTLQKPFAACR